ncbi:MAG: RNA 2',3'-cyclic phosphodiesterase [Candidatus Dormibacteria bacterium]
MRCFLALPLRPPALAVAQRALERLRAEVDAVRWARPETLHITLHFFGVIDDSALARALTATRPALESARAFDISVDELGAFPERGTPRVLWLGSSADNTLLLALAADIRSRLRGAGFAVEERPFRTHATLGRPRDPWPPEARVAWDAVQTQGVKRSEFLADRAVLYESVTGPGPAQYVERAVLPLGGAS